MICAALKRACTYAAFYALIVIPAQAQEDYGFSVPVTLSGGAMYTQRLQSEDAKESPAAAAFRAMLYPTLELGHHWFGYAAVQVRSTPYFYYDAFDSGHHVYADAIQAFIGYSLHVAKATLIIKAGKLSTAFGAFPLDYDDALNPLLDQPLSYVTDLPFGPGQILSGTNSLLYRRQYSDLVPVTLDGLPGVEADLSAGRADARLQLTSGSPANPQSIGDAGKFLQWAAGAGYTIQQGFRVGVSGFRGPYLNQSVAPLLPAGTTVRDFPASGLGSDAQWARGRWSASGELQWFRFDSPGFVVSPSITSGYVELKATLTPRLYLAGRCGFLDSGRVQDESGVSAAQFAPNIKSYELSAGVWVRRNQLLKAGYEWQSFSGQTGSRANVLGAEYVMQFHSLSWAFR